MNFDFDETEQTFQTAVRRYAQTRILPDAARWDRGERLPRERVLALGELGVLGIRVPQAPATVGQAAHHEDRAPGRATAGLV